MHKMRAILGVVVLLHLLLATGTVAQPQEPTPQSTDVSQSASLSGQPAISNQPSTLWALRGVIVSTASLLGSKVRNLQGKKVGTVQHLIMNPGIQLVVKTEADKTMQIQVGLAWYLAHQEAEVAAHQTVQVPGAMTKINEQAVLLARRVQFDGHTLTLRDAQGLPMWSSVRRRASP